MAVVLHSGVVTELAVTQRQKITWWSSVVRQQVKREGSGVAGWGGGGVGCCAAKDDGLVWSAVFVREHKEGES